MSQQVKDVYSGMKKIFPGSHRSNSFRMSGTGLESEFSTEAQAIACEKTTKRKTRPSSFSFTSWKDKHCASSEPTPVVMSLPYGATAATPKAKKTSDNMERNSLTQTITNAFQSSPLFSGNRNSKYMVPQRNSHKTTKEVTMPQSGVSTVTVDPPKLGGRSISAGGEFPPSFSNRTLGNAGNMPLRHCPNLEKSAIGGTNHSLISFHTVKTAPSSYQSSSTAFSDLTASSVNNSTCSTSSSSPLSTDPTLDSPESTDKKMRVRKTREQEATQVQSSTWNSDSEDEYENTKRPTRLDRRSQSMDFMEQAPTHLIAKLWRKLPIQARLIGGRGSIDLDLQKDRTSFSRSSEARKFALAADKAKALELQRRSSFGRKVSASHTVTDILSPGVTKRLRFGGTPTIIVTDPNYGPAAYTVLESYDDVLVRVCKFASHDQRPTSTKVQEFLERSLAFLHGTRTKHGNVVNISNEEIRMWRRLALHDWTLEEVTTAQAAAALGVKGKDVSAQSSRTSSLATEGTDSDSDSQSMSNTRRRLQSLSECVAENEPEKEEDGDLDVPSNAKFDQLCAVINCCINFGQMLYKPEEISDLVRLKFIVEEDGWI
ncbi:uncharacterized protein PHALS_13028 [Plasmopara halstedii]|uniref:Uncharacterized protein n=1 Tax=Plasmopara halstedii TaxID=4781 RepID=A0A0N7L5Y6_PLAHL|nr:uncharacterized protein PHALS_13028 [Plasmopara halstedii]CEG42779.1 hypothetical protein PHALS_13028 [Plasmopara halstedii]|eukprot:XP_024579148.1 hypothetical protein PHALS_13028 [Plasmopara halstedii]